MPAPIQDSSRRALAMLQFIGALGAEEGGGSSSMGCRVAVTAAMSAAWSSKAGSACTSGRVHNDIQDMAELSDEGGCAAYLMVGKVAGHRAIM